ncbi:MAG: hypothetical protein GXO83_09895 [Chlorobi bacterium]|nr:hypothetical protein [Chlorobiota bacterium]
MKRRAVMSKMISLLVISVLFLYTGGCKKQKCGCDGEELFTLNDQAGILYYSDTKYSYFISDGVYSYFTICNPDGVWDMIKKFKNGDKVWITGSVSDDCMKKVSGWYYSNYVIRVENIREPEF